MYESDDLSDSAEAVNLKRQRTMSYLQRQLELLPPPPDGLNEEQRERLMAIYTPLGGGLPQCSLATTRNLFRDQSFSVDELSRFSRDKGDIRVLEWESVMEPLRQPDEVYRCFAVERVSSALLSDVRLAACMRKGSTHVTALLRADSRSVRHYDNDSSARQRGTFESLSLRGGNQRSDHAARCPEAGESDAARI